MTKLYAIDSDGFTVWVNGHTGECLGRFGRYGIDVHNTTEVQESGRPQCLYCTHGTVTAEDWHTFVSKMSQHHDIDPAELGEYVPDRFSQKSESA